MKGKEPTALRYLAYLLAIAALLSTIQVSEIDIALKYTFSVISTLFLLFLFWIVDRLVYLKADIEEEFRKIKS